MMELLQFIFQDFWHWAGFAILVALPCSSLIGLIKITIHRHAGPKG